MHTHRAQSEWKSASQPLEILGSEIDPLLGVSDCLCLSHTLDQEAEYGDQ